MSWALFVEGDYDEVFVRWLWGTLDSEEDVEIHRIDGGISKLHSVQNEIRKSHDAGRNVALLLDADTNPDRTRRQLAREIARLDLPIERSFLLPDDVAPGNLETLLEQMAPAAHRVVYICFDQYEECLSTPDRDYTTPNRKARVYAYCNAVGADTGPEKNYADAAHWDPAVPGLEPLRRFLRDLNRVDETDTDATPEAPDVDTD